MPTNTSSPSYTTTSTSPTTTPSSVSVGNESFITSSTTSTSSPRSSEALSATRLNDWLSQSFKDEPWNALRSARS
ncbi:hypothetical protein BU24DRAFT_461045 [Aaosphaeria arxii CBS 175.79]|uniref:Uncharacterized protein n=1 Tax=Aaosphaeria arxii CBS 175.79 TaxID=1450172 RepID=A0A6A5XZC7_9PLEO|nr:uncharacterized protein BU24DRAFT_461045 [Aaosphaeria arxii CBS 175.79]KAF2018071.1 hypothetical protein BU24DRAFT_461045 [Aaosphaeria arxii CBS 175.79]